MAAPQFRSDRDATNRITGSPTDRFLPPRSQIDHSRQRREKQCISQNTQLPCTLQGKNDHTLIFTHARSRKKCHISSRRGDGHAWAILTRDTPYMTIIHGAPLSWNHSPRPKGEGSEGTWRATAGSGGRSASSNSSDRVPTERPPTRRPHRRDSLRQRIPWRERRRIARRLSPRARRLPGAG
jgi:hypothetical protein